MTPRKLQLSAQHDSPFAEAFVAHCTLPQIPDSSLAYAYFVKHPELLLRKELLYSGGAEGCPLLFHDKIVEGEDALCRLRKYGIHVPFFAYIVAPNAKSGEPCLYSIAERVHGKNIAALNSVSVRLVQKIESMFVGFVHYIVDARSSGKPFWTDFKMSQFMYGKLASNSRLQVYLVDVEPYVGRFIPHSGVGGESEDIAWRRYVMQLSHVCFEIERIEERGPRGGRLLRVRKVLKEALLLAPRSPLYDEFRDNLFHLLSC